MIDSASVLRFETSASAEASLDSTSDLSVRYFEDLALVINHCTPNQTSPPPKATAIISQIDCILL